MTEDPNGLQKKYFDREENGILYFNERFEAKMTINLSNRSWHWDAGLWFFKNTRQGTLESLEGVQLARGGVPFSIAWREWLNPIEWLLVFSGFASNRGINFEHGSLSFNLIFKTWVTPALFSINEGEPGLHPEREAVICQKAKIFAQLLGVPTTSSCCLGRDIRAWLTKNSQTPTPSMTT